MFSDVNAVVRYYLKGSSPSLVMYPVVVPSRPAATNMLNVSPAKDRSNVTADSIGLSENNSIMHSPIVTISGMTIDASLFLLVHMH